MIKSLFLSIVIVFSLNSFSQTLKVDEVIGTWLVGNSKAKIKIYKNGTKYYGKIVWLREPTDADGKSILKMAKLINVKFLFAKEN